MDDALDVFAVHGIGGMWGCLATGIFTVSALAGVDGLLGGDMGKQLGIQAIGAVGTMAYSGIATFIILFILDKIPGLGLRESEANEDQGLALSTHGEQGSVDDGAN